MAPVAVIKCEGFCIIFILERIFLMFAQLTVPPSHLWVFNLGWVSRHLNDKFRVPSLLSGVERSHPHRHLHVLLFRHPTAQLATTSAIFPWFYCLSKFPVLMLSHNAWPFLWNLGGGRNGNSSVLVQWQQVRRRPNVARLLRGFRLFSDYLTATLPQHCPVIWVGHTCSFLRPGQFSRQERRAAPVRCLYQSP